MLLPVVCVVVLLFVLLAPWSAGGGDREDMALSYVYADSGVSIMQVGTLSSSPIPRLGLSVFFLSFFLRVLDRGELALLPGEGRRGDAMPPPSPTESGMGSPSVMATESDRQRSVAGGEA